MKQKNLDELRNIYLGLVTGGEGPEVLSEAPGGKAKFWDSKLGRFVTSVVFKPGTGPESFSPDPALGLGTPAKAAVPVKSVPVKPKVSQYTRKNLGDKQFADFKAGGGDAAVLKGASAGEIVAKGRVAQRPPAGPGGGGNGSSDNDSSGNGSSGNGSGGPTRPAASGPVLSKLKGVEGTGVGANFKAKAFTDTEKTRYSSVAAAKPAIPTGTTAGGTTFQRRAATGDELRAAQASRAAGGSEESAIKAGVGASKPVAPVGDKFGTTSTIKPPSPTQVKSDTPTTQLTKMQPSSSDNTSSSSPEGMSKRLEDALKIKKSDVTSSYQFPMSKTLRDLSNSYNEIYEAKKQVDQVGQEDDDIDNDGDTDNSDKYLLNRRKVRSKAIGEATAMSKRGYDEVPIRNKIAAKTSASGAGSFADKATALADKETYGDKKKKEGREKLARKQRGDFRDTTSSSPGLRGYGYKSDDPEVKAKQDARGNQRGRAALTPNERKQLNMEYDLYDLIQSHLLEYGFADTEEGANMIIENMSQSWIKQILSED